MTVRSMTAFARHTEQGEAGSVTWELRSVNHRYLEMNIKLPEQMRELENALREKIKAKLSRGKVDIFLKYQLSSGSESLQVNEETAKALSDATRKVQSIFWDSAPVTAIDVLNWPGVLKTSSATPEALQKVALAGLDAALDNMLEARMREGEEMKNHIMPRLDKVDSHVTEVRKLVPEIIAKQQEKIRDRLTQIVTETNPERLEQELVLLAQKLDVDEEMDRLVTHINEVRRILTKGGVIGRRLDFLMQEMNREANTLSSKSAASDTTGASVDIKVLIEQMREQIQNIE